MIITLPKEINCSLEEYEIKIIESCCGVLEEIRNKIEACEWEYAHTSWGDEIGSSEFDDIIKRLVDIIHIDKIY